MAAFIIIILGIGQILGGIIAFVDAASSIHQILGAVLFGMGILSVGMGLIITHLAAIRESQ